MVTSGKSQPAKNRNLSRLISSLSRLKKRKAPSTCVPRNLPCLVFESSNMFLYLYLTAQQYQNHSTSSRNRNMGNRVTSNHDNETHWGSASVFYSLIWALQNEWLFLHASARTFLNFHGLRVTISYQISWRILPQSPSRVLVVSTSRVSPTHYPRWHPAKSKSQPANTKVSRQLASEKVYDDHPVQTRIE